jgi:hypothetical protein
MKPNKCTSQLVLGTVYMIIFFFSNMQESCVSHYCYALVYFKVHITLLIPTV